MKGVANKYQHFIPQCYLRNFTDKEGDSFLYCYDKKASKVHTIPIAKICGEEDLYSIGKDFVSEELDKLSIEKDYFSKNIEPEYSRIIKEIVSCQQRAEIISKELKIEFAKFIVIQFLRLPTIKEMDTDISNELLPDMIQLFKESLVLEKKDSDIKNLDVGYLFDNSLNHFSSSYGNGETVQYFAKQLALNYWNLCTAKNGTFFTSDFPIVVNPHVKDVRPLCLGLTQYGAELSFPVTKNIMLIIWDKKYFYAKKETDCKYFELEDKKVVALNKLRYLYAKRYLLSNSNDFSIIESVVKYNGSNQITFNI